MVYTSQAIKISISETTFFTPFFAPFAKFLLNVKFRGCGRLNLNIELLQTKCTDFRFYLTKVKIHNTCHVSVSLWMRSFQINSGKMKSDVINITA